MTSFQSQPFSSEFTAKTRQYAKFKIIVAVEGREKKHPAVLFHVILELCLTIAFSELCVCVFLWQINIQVGNLASLLNQEALEEFTNVETSPGKEIPAHNSADGQLI